MKGLVLFAATTLIATFTFAQARPQTFPNSTKYQDAGLKPARGQAGIGAIEARALLGRDQITTLEVTTGTFDGAAPAGNIDKVQLKRVIDNRTITTNDTNLADGGYYVDQLTGVMRHDVLHVQANVSGIEPNRMDVVAASETVKLRPDLLVGGLTIPPVVRAGVPATLSVNVSEVNGDVGARANCVLSVDGVEADRAAGIWVDARGAVTCTFNTIFATGGVHHITIAAIDVTPGDWDTANNSASAQVEVVASAPFVRYRLQAHEIETVSRSTTNAPWTQSEERWTIPTQSLIFMAATDQPMNLETMTATVQTSSDGVALDDSTPIPLERATVYDGDSWGWGCFQGWEPATRRNITGCGSWYVYNGELTGSVDLTYSREATTVTYHSFGWDKRFYNQDGSYWTWNYSSSTTNGAFLPWGNTVTLHVTLTDGTKTFEATPTVSFTPHSFEWGYGYCFEDWYTGETGCFQYLRTETGRTGLVTHGY